MNLGKRLWLISALLCLTVVLAGCSSGLRIGWMGSDSHASMQAKYTHWSGSKQKTINLEKNEVLEFAYEAKVKKGSLVIEVLAPADEALLSVSLEQDTEDKLQLTAEEAGKYIVRVRGAGAGGSFSTSWTKIQP